MFHYMQYAFFNIYTAFEMIVFTNIMINKFIYII